MTEHRFSSEEINRVLLVRKNRVMVDDALASQVDQTRVVLSMAKNIEDLGFLFSRKLFDSLRFQPEDVLVAFYQHIVPVLAGMVGSHVAHQAFYRNFPQELVALPELDLYMNALVHYWSNGRWVPEYAGRLRFPIADGSFQVRMIEPGSIDDFERIFVEMLNARGSLSNQDKELLGWFIQKSAAEDLARLLPEVIPARETLSLVVGAIFEHHPETPDLAARYVKTATDVLRLVTALSGGDVSLASNSRFRNFSRCERRWLLHLLEQCDAMAEDMSRHPGKWLRVGEKLHPGDYSKQYPALYEAFRKLRNGEKVASFSAKVELALSLGDLTGALGLLEQRPGELARRLDHLARLFPAGTQQVEESFSRVIGKLPSPILLQLMTHFKSRNQAKTTHSYFPKGNIAKIKVVEKPFSPLPAEFCVQMVERCTAELLLRFSRRPPLGKVYIDPILRDMVVPLAQRSSSQALKTYARGSRFALGSATRTLRAFIHWKNIAVNPEAAGASPDGDFGGEGGMGDSAPALQPISDWRTVLSGGLDAQRDPSGSERVHQKRTDIDLSLGLYDGDWNFIETIAYYSLRSSRMAGLYHSGDFVDAPQGASEFIDMDLAELRASGIRYAVFNVFSFTRQGFDQIPECFFGWMEREEPGSGEVFEPRTVVNKIDLASPSTICLPVLFDLEAGMAVWMDIALKSSPNWVNNLAANSNNVVLISKAMLETRRPDLFTLFALHGQARGQVVDSPEEADVTFGIGTSDSVTPFDVETILSEYL